MTRCCLLPVTLLHDGNLLDDLLQIRFDRNLLDGHHLARLLMDGFKHTAIGAKDTSKTYIKINTECTIKKANSINKLKHYTAKEVHVKRRILYLYGTQAERGLGEDCSWKK